MFGALVAVVFVLFNANLRGIGALDPIPSTLLPSSLLRDGDTDLSEFRPMLGEAGWYDTTLAFGTLQARDGRLVSSYPIGAALVALPVYAVPEALGWLSEWRDYQAIGKIAASLIVALSVGFVFLAAAQISGTSAGAVVALAYALGTGAWSTASQALWQHGPGMLCLSVALLLLLRLDRGGGAAAAVGAGIALALALLCRGLNLVPAAALGLFVLIRHPRQVWIFALPLAIASAWQAYYNVTVYGDVSGGYAAILQSDWHRSRGLTPATLFGHPLLEGLLGLLVSPGKGLLVYSPFLAIPLVGLVPASLDRAFPLGRYIALWMLLVLIPLAKNALWWGGTSYGGRYLTEASVGLSLVLAWAWPWLAVRRLALGLACASIATSIAIHGLGAFVAQCGWHEQPTIVDFDPARLWDWSDTEIERCARVGVRDGVHRMELLDDVPNPGPALTVR